MNRTATLDHHTDWDLAQWWVHYVAAIAVPMLAAAIVVGLWLAFSAVIGRAELSNLTEAALGLLVTVGAFGAGSLGLYWTIELLYGTLRHTSSAPRAAAATLVVAVFHAALAFSVATALGVTDRTWIVAMVLACAVPPGFAQVSDGIVRSTAGIAYDTTEASVPTAVYSPDAPQPRGAALSRARSRSPPAQQPSQPQSGVHGST